MTRIQGKTAAKAIAILGLATWLIPFPKRSDMAKPRTKLDEMRSLDGLVPDAQEPFKALIEQAKTLGMRPWVISVRRPCVKHKPGSKVAGCRSWHVLGRAVDIQLQSKAGKIDDREPYDTLGRYWKAIGGIWGGDFTRSYPNGIPGYEKAGPGDVVHFQWTHGLVGVPASICDDSDCEGSVKRYFDNGGNIT